jgi:short-subunit dehydrogenase involved in D-alanine esterification of teichoic acids
MNIQGKTILITGGGSGIGLESAKQFLNLGAKVIVTGRNNAKLELVKQAYPDIITFQSDVSNASDAETLFQQVKQLGA